MGEIGLQQNTAPHTRASSGGVVDTLVSATLFGALGATIGHWIGVRSENAERKLARPFLTFVGGAFFAILAAFTSWQLHRRHNEIVAQTPETDAALVKQMPEQTEEKHRGDVAPKVTVDAAFAEHQGALSTPELQRV